MILSELIKNDNIIFVDVEDVKSAIKELVSKAHDLNYIKNEKKFFKAILERENIVSTGIGLGIAIPHSKSKDIENFFIIIGILKNAIEWNAIDSKPVKAVFLIGGPSNAQKRYLGILSKLMLLIRSSDIREKLFNARLNEDITDIFINL